MKKKVLNKYLDTRIELLSRKYSGEEYDEQLLERIGKIIVIEMPLVTEKEEKLIRKLMKDVKK